MLRSFLGRKWVLASLANTVSGEVTTTVVGAANNVAAGLHTVTAGCVEPGAGAADYNNGNLNVIAVG
jgi:hypothetical protein